jgi:hypothetical protein
MMPEMETEGSEVAIAEAMLADVGQQADTAEASEAMDADMMDSAMMAMMVMLADMGETSDGASDAGQNQPVSVMPPALFAQRNAFASDRVVVPPASSIVPELASNTIAEPLFGPDRISLPELPGSIDFAEESLEGEQPQIDQAEATESADDDMMQVSGSDNDEVPSELVPAPAEAQPQHADVGEDTANAPMNQEVGPAAVRVTGDQTGDPLKLATGHSSLDQVFSNYESSETSANNEMVSAGVGLLVATQFSRKDDRRVHRPRRVRPR